MKIAVIGSGGLGGYYGGLLARAGHEVHFISRGVHLAALRQRGLQVNSVHGDFHVAPVRATDNAQEVGPADLVLVCVKTPALDAAARAARPMVGPDTVVMGLQNGIEAPERIGAAVGMEHVLAAVTWIAANIEAPVSSGRLRPSGGSYWANWTVASAPGSSARSRRCAAWALP